MFLATNVQCNRREITSKIDALVEFFCALLSNIIEKMEVIFSSQLSLYINKMLKKIDHINFYNLNN